MLLRQTRPAQRVAGKRHGDDSVDVVANDHSKGDAMLRRRPRALRLERADGGVQTFAVEGRMASQRLPLGPRDPAAVGGRRARAATEARPVTSPRGSQALPPKPNPSARPGAPLPIYDGLIVAIALCLGFWTLVIWAAIAWLHP